VPARKLRADAMGDFDQNLGFGRLIVDRVYGVEAQSVEEIFVQPVKRALDEELPYRLLFKGDRRTPGRMALGMEEIRGILRQVVSFGSEVVVDDVEQNHEALAVRGVDEGFHVLRLAISTVRCIGQNAVIAPAALAG